MDTVTHSLWLAPILTLQHSPTGYPADLNIPKHSHTTPLFGGPSEDKGLAMGTCGQERGPGLAFFQKSGLIVFDNQKKPVRGKRRIFSPPIQWPNPVSFSRPGLLIPRLLL